MARYSFFDLVQLDYADAKSGPKITSFEDANARLDIALDAARSSVNDPLAFRGALISLASVALKTIDDRSLAPNAVDGERKVTQKRIDSQFKSLKNNGGRVMANAVEAYGFVRLATICIEQKIAIQSTSKIGDDLAWLVFTIVRAGDDLKLADLKEKKKVADA